MQPAVVESPPPTLPLPNYPTVTLPFYFVTTPFSAFHPTTDSFPTPDLDRSKLKSMSNVVLVLLPIEPVCGLFLWPVSSGSLCQSTESLG